MLREVAMRFEKIGWLTVAIWMCGSTLAQAESRHNKSESVREKEEKADTKNLRTYVKIKAYAEEKYRTDPAFRDDVDNAYTELLRQHTEEAYERNISRSSRMWTVQEDQFRLHTGLYDSPL